MLVESVDIPKVAVVGDDGFVEDQAVSGDDGIGTVQVFETVRSPVFPSERSCSAGDTIVECNGNSSPDDRRVLPTQRRGVV